MACSQRPRSSSWDGIASPGFRAWPCSARAGAVDVWRRVQARAWNRLAWRVGLLAIPAVFLAWRPLPNPSPDHWGHAEITLALAYLGAGELDPAIDALDDARAIGAGPAAQVEQLISGGMVHDRLAELIAERRESSSEPDSVSLLRHAAWLRNLPEHQQESLRLLSSIRDAEPDNLPAERELGTWWLAHRTDPDALRQAIETLTAAARDPNAALLLALVTKDPRRLPSPPSRPDSEAPRPDRLRLARAILEDSS